MIATADEEICVTADQRLGFLDLTDELNRVVKNSGVRNGIAVAFCRHTTCGLVINEWETGLLEDLRLRLELMFPTDAYYAHDDPEKRSGNALGEEEPRNGYAHLSQMSFTTTTKIVPVRDGEPMWGQWQRLIFVELDEPRSRRVGFSVMGT